jgi:hypothetical protein
MASATPSKAGHFVCPLLATIPAREILIGGGKQPVSALGAGFVEVVPLQDVDASKYRHLALADDIWHEQPFAGRVVRETDKVFDPYR